MTKNGEDLISINSMHKNPSQLDNYLPFEYDNNVNEKVDPDMNMTHHYVNSQLLNQNEALQIQIEELMNENETLNQKLAQNLPIDAQKKFRELNEARIKAELETEFVLEKLEKTAEEIKMYKEQMQIMESRIEKSYQNQHEIENILEEYEVVNNKHNLTNKKTTKKYQDLQKKFAALEVDKTYLEEKHTLLEKEKRSITDKWIKMTNRTKNDEKQKNKIRDQDENIKEHQYENSKLIEEITQLENTKHYYQKEVETKLKTITEQSKMICRLENQTKSQNESTKINEQIRDDLLHKLQACQKEIEILNIERNNLIEECRQLEELEGVQQLLEEKVYEIQELKINLLDLKKEKESNEDKLLKRENSVFITKEMLEDSQQRIRELEKQVKEEKLRSFNYKKEFQTIMTQLSCNKDSLSHKFSDETTTNALFDLHKVLTNGLHISQNIQGFYKSNQKGNNQYKATCSNISHDTELSFIIVRANTKITDLQNIINNLTEENNNIKEKYSNLEIDYNKCIKDLKAQQKYIKGKCQKENTPKNQPFKDQTNIFRISNKNELVNSVGKLFPMDLSRISPRGLNDDERGINSPRKSKQKIQRISVLSPSKLNLTSRDNYLMKERTKTRNGYPNATVVSTGEIKVIPSKKLNRSDFKPPRKNNESNIMRNNNSRPNCRYAEKQSNSRNENKSYGMNNSLSSKKTANIWNK